MDKQLFKAITNQDFDQINSIQITIMGDFKIDKVKANVEANRIATERYNNMFMIQGGPWARISADEAMELFTCMKDLRIHYLDDTINFVEVLDASDMVKRIKEDRTFAFYVGEVDPGNSDVVVYGNYVYYRISQRDAQAIVDNNIFTGVYVLEGDKAINYSHAKSIFFEDNEFLICVLRLEDIMTRKEEKDLLINDAKYAWLTVTPTIARKLVEFTDIEVYSLDVPYEHQVDEYELEECIEEGGVPLAIPIGFVSGEEEEGDPIKITEDYFVWRTFTTLEAVHIWKHDLFVLYELHDNGAESLIEGNEDFMEAISNGAVFGVEAGFLYEAGRI